MSITKITLAVAASSILALTACEPLQDPNNPNRQTQTGALVGAGVGALIGASTGGDDIGARRRGALIGAAVGAGGGALVGRELDKQEAELRQQLGSNVGIVNNGNQLIVTLPQDILFATDSTSVSGSLQGDLRNLAASLNRYPNTTVNVIGHTDNTGTAAYNQDLSTRRAQSVASVLINSGVSSGRIRAIGRGEDQPVASNLSVDGRAQNRRVEIIITPNG